MEYLTSLIGGIAGFLWGNALTLIALLGTALYLTLHMDFIQLRGFRHNLDLAGGKYSSYKNLDNNNFSRPRNKKGVILCFPPI